MNKYCGQLKQNLSTRCEWFISNVTHWELFVTFGLEIENFFPWLRKNKKVSRGYTCATYLYSKHYLRACFRF
jgi:hypothetical protein